MSRLDLKTKLFLSITNVVIEKKHEYTIGKVPSNVAYVFDSYEEFKKYFQFYLPDVPEEVINLAIYTKSKKGAIIALKGLCDQIITQSKLQYYIKPLSQKEIEEIHSRGKITPLEKVKEWEAFDLCAPGDTIGSVAKRCAQFSNNCHECLVEYASHQLEYDPISFKH